MNLSQKQINNFKYWLSERGAELLPPTNSYEVVRFRCNHGTGVVYTGKKGNKFSDPFVSDAFSCYSNSKKWDGKFKTVRRVSGKHKRELLIRDGDECFYCGEVMPEDDITKEHLFSIAQGGRDHINNCVLAHKLCNDKAGHLPIIEKVKMREKMRELS